MTEEPADVGGERADALGEVRAALRERRRELGLSQQEVAQRMGLKSRTNVAELEKGIHDVGTQRLARWVAAVEARLSLRVADGAITVHRAEDA